MKKFKFLNQFPDGVIVANNSGDVILRVGSATDIPLTETGMKQAYAAGELLAEKGFAPEMIFAL